MGKNTRWRKISIKTSVELLATKPTQLKSHYDVTTNGEECLMEEMPSKHLSSCWRLNQHKKVKLSMTNDGEGYLMEKMAIKLSVELLATKPTHQKV